MADGDDSPTGPVAPSLRELHETDLYLWTRAQADSLRRLAAEPVGAALGADKLAAEVDALGEELKARAFARLVEVMSLRLEADAEGAPAIVTRIRRELEGLGPVLPVEVTPALARAAASELGRLYADATVRAARRLALRGALAPELDLPLRCPWTVDELVGRRPAPAVHDLGWAFPPVR